MLLSGKKVQKSIVSQLQADIEKYENPLQLIIIQVGDDFASSKYVKNKLIFGEKIGIEVQIIKYDINIEEDLILEEIAKLNKNEQITGIIVQLPLPPHLNADKITQAITPSKDVDGFHATNIGQTYLGKPGLVAATPKGVVKMLDFYQIPITGQHIVIAGSSNNVGKMVAVLLINRGATVTSCNSQTKNIKKLIATADIFISAIGRPHFFQKEIFINKPKLVIIDIGISLLNSKSVGDVDYREVEPYVQAITPVPGGVGPMTVTMLMDNVVQAQKIKGKKTDDNG